MKIEFSRRGFIGKLIVGGFVYFGVEKYLCAKESQQVKKGEQTCDYCVYRESWKNYTTAGFEAGLIADMVLGKRCNPGGGRPNFVPTKVRLAYERLPTSSDNLVLMGWQGNQYVYGDLDSFMFVYRVTGNVV